MRSPGAINLVDAIFRTRDPFEFMSLKVDEVIRFEEHCLFFTNDYPRLLFKETGSDGNGLLISP